MTTIDIKHIGHKKQTKKASKQTPYPMFKSYSSRKDTVSEA